VAFASAIIAVAAASDEIGDEIDDEVKTRRAAPSHVACKQQFGKFAENDGAGGCRCLEGYQAVDGQCVEASGESVLPLLAVALFFVILAGAVIYWASTRGHDGGAKAGAREEEAEGVGGARRTALGRMRARRQARGEEDEEEEEDGGKKIGKKKLAKLEAKEERAAQREAMEEERARRKELAEKRDEEAREREEERRREKEAEAEAEKKALEEQKKKEEEEFDKWKDLFETADDGAQADDDLQESQGLLQEFIDYLRYKKIAALDEVAGEFKLKSQEVVNRVEGLEAMGRITGLLDDRGKFIYISLEEMEAVAKWIKLQGRISVGDLAVESNRLIDLEPKEVPSRTMADADVELVEAAEAETTPAE